ncbi:MAG TPA: hypothetical protein VK589_11825 [Chryseolinea sp.]|nr:hypothetical protein [Chryseolinea sp.]
MRPTRKVPISAERIRRAQELLRKGDGKGAAAALRQVREGLERYESRLFNKRKS